MPWYATAYVLVLIALAGMGWQAANRLGLPRTLRNGDALATLASIVLTIAYWHERWRLALGGLAVPLFVASVAWTLYAVKPMVELGLHLAASRADGTGATDRIGVVLTCLVGLLVGAPAMLWGLRVCRAALGV